MALTAPIEVRAGADGLLRAVLCAVWLAALLSSLVHISQLSWWVIGGVVATLCCSFPMRRGPALNIQTLLLQPNGQVTFAREKGTEVGTWSRSIWHTRWYTVLDIEQGGLRWQAWISARNNSPDEYRRLSVWSRYSPQQAIAKSRQ